MLIYQDTHDTRADSLRENLYSLAYYLDKGIWRKPVDNQTLKKSKNGWIPVYKSLFGIYKKSNGEISSNTKLILNNQLDLLLVEFIKKFQFPFPKASNKEINGDYLYMYQLKHNYRICPLRTLVKLLFFRKVYLHKNYVTVKEIQDYIIANKFLIFSQYRYNIHDLECDIHNHSFDNSFNTNISMKGGYINRLIDPLLAISGYASFLKYTNKHNPKESTIKLDISTSTKLHYVLNILAFNGFCKFNNNLTQNKHLFMKYMQYDNKSYNDSYLYNPYHLLGNLNDNKGSNIILFGAPGVGKSYKVQDIIRDCGINHYNNNDNNCPNVLRITLYPDYDYTDFVGQIMPSEDSNHHITYREKAGIFTKALMRAYSDLSKPVFLILEEMSRCNIESVFGDIFQLLDRYSNGFSEYSINNELMSKKLYGIKDHKIKIPRNLFIIGTLNTSDQDVYPLDTAFKRRFEWHYISINNGQKQQINFSAKNSKISWNRLRIKINDFIVNKMHLEEDKQLGQFFINFHVLDSNNKFIRKSYSATNSDCNKMKNKLLFYLWNDVDKIYRELHPRSTNVLLNSRIFSKLYCNYHPNKDVLGIFSKEFIKNEISNK